MPVIPTMSARAGSKSIGSTLSSISVTAWCGGAAQLVELAQRSEQLDYSALWYPEVLGYECFSLASYLLTHSTKLIVASGIANIYARDPTATKQGQHTLAKFSDGRFLLGLGVSHTLLGEGISGGIGPRLDC
jgi:alkanesulfonate monooxygenase SsuD/methylene tetrahydromethanopterin reductase-like flavin-dependent oxidoreductase (luciferase family)